MTNEEIIIQLTETQDRSKSNTRRIDKIEAQNDALLKIASSVEILAIGQESLKDDMTTVKEDVETLKAEPGRKWDKLSDYVLLAVAGYLLGLITNGLGL